MGLQRVLRSAIVVDEEKGRTRDVGCVCTGTAFHSARPETCGVPLFLIANGKSPEGNMVPRVSQGLWLLLY